VDTCRGTGIENGSDNHSEASRRGGGSFASELLNNIHATGNGDIVDLLITTSERAAGLFPDNSLQLIFLDARHDEESVRKDILAWLPKVAPGAIIAGDDIGVPNEANPIWPGVKAAVSALLPDFEYVPHDAWRWRKPR
jgi:predicted O-methyltransferase YrrM